MYLHNVTLCTCTNNIVLLHVMFRSVHSQVDRFVSEEVEPALTQYESVLSTTAELKI